MVDIAVTKCIIGILLGCGVNVVFLEMITKRDPKAGGLVTLAQFLFVACEGLISNLEQSKYYFPKPRARAIPLWFHLFITFTFFSVSIINNMALSYNIAMPLHMVFRSSSLAASLLIGSVFLKKSYGTNQIQGVLLVTSGIIVTTFADAFQQRAECCDGNATKTTLDPEQADTDALHTWLVGLAMLTFALFVSAGMGHLQEWAYKKWGKQSTEMKFYSHALALPYFYVLQGSAIGARVAEWNQSETLGEAIKMELPTLLSSIPVLWLLLFGNIASQLVCISSVYRLTAISSTLTCTMTITIRKFLSIIFSVVYFSNPFSLMHWMGTALVFVGVGLYSGIFTRSQSEEKKKTQ
uniref:UAA transporter n=1 Tax=Mucochytrium quahogii TaxID=96639 RepID=A0A7S2RDS6_9STRA|mmetsp:Transcript_97/g.233  ORF Transcript_97/g.233 Transcript_97/m.233 type:complete len:352 (-) Transcript_97:158-1213(-)